MAHKQEEFDFEKSELQKKIDAFDDRQNTLEYYLKNKTELENEKRILKEEVDHLSKEMQRQLADKDRERVQATDKLKNDMLHKIQETKTSLFALKKEQMNTTTRLTVLQNHQLTTELEYQSKQTEKLLFKNAKLQEQVTTLKRDVEIHKQVEQELAKRSHFSQKLIKKLSTKIKELEEEGEGLKKFQEQNGFFLNNIFLIIVLIMKLQSSPIKSKGKTLSKKKKLRMNLSGSWKRIWRVLKRNWQNYKMTMTF